MIFKRKIENIIFMNMGNVLMLFGSKYSYERE